MPKQKTHKGAAKRFDVTKTGKVAGEEMVQVAIRALANDHAPIKELKGFDKLNLQPGETKNAVVTLTGESFQYYDANIDELSTRSGRYELLYGPSSKAEELKSLPFEVK